MQEGEEPPTSAPLSSFPLDFESTLLVADESIRSSHKRARQVMVHAKKVLQKPGQVSVVDQDPEHTLKYALTAVAAVAGTDAPKFNLDSDARQIYMWVVKTLSHYGDECREEGARLERDGAEPRIPTATALEALKLMSNLNDLLSTQRRDA
jgi:hypothetical protein